MYMDKDYNGWYEQCLQCSFIHDLPVMFEGKAKADSAGSKKMETGK